MFSRVLATLSLAKFFVGLASLFRSVFLMAYTLPTFNLNVNIWRYGNDVQANPPDVTSGGNLVANYRGDQSPIVVALDTVANMQVRVKEVAWLMTLLLPKGTDVQPYMGGPVHNFGDCVEVPAGSGRFYVVLFVDDIGRGFQNEHRFAVISPLYGLLTAQAVFTGWNTPAWPAPIP